MTLYLDTSVVVPLVITEPTSEAVGRWLREQRDRVLIGRLTVGETGSAISRRRRMGKLTEEEGERALDAFDEWLSTSVAIVDHEPRDIADAARFVRRPVPKLLMPDAIHLATCRRLGCRLATADKPLTAVADLLRVAWLQPA